MAPPNPFLTAINQILSLLSSERKTLQTHPRLLAWLMNEYHQLHEASHHAHRSHRLTQKPKIALLTLTVNRPYQRKIYDAWFAAHYQQVRSPLHSLATKANKNMDEYCQMLLAKRPGRLASQMEVYDHLLCAPRNEYQWNTAGYLVLVGPANTELSTYLNFQKTPLPIAFKRQCLWLQNPVILAARRRSQKHLQQLRQRAHRERKLIAATDPPARPFVFSEINRTSNITRMPANAHPSYIRAAQTIVQEILLSAQSSERNHYQAEKLWRRLSQLAVALEDPS